MTTAPTTGRRELNKARTRESIVAAVRTLLEQHPVADITADQVADEAGISRRTFFNYYSGIPAVLIEVLSGYAALLVERVSLEALREGPVEALRALVRTGGLPPEFLDWLVALNCHPHSGDGSVLIERAVWAQMGAWLEGVLHERLPEARDPLYVSTLASAVMHAFAATEQTWLEQLADPCSPTADDYAAFHVHLDRALGYLAQGWRPTP
ncbi:MULTISPECIES: TetR/AcrR family transcriptional regulator [unclassified Ornithinimicrobium]|uniref:TetR/AcrR family transcriptional regulator n=1 Tax=unclassified Ornithinimicrobium TaxID=2615080 RepID=UPI00385559D6